MAGPPPSAGGFFPPSKSTARSQQQTTSTRRLRTQQPTCSNNNNGASSIIGLGGGEEGGGSTTNCTISDRHHDTSHHSDHSGHTNGHTNGPGRSSLQQDINRVVWRRREAESPSTEGSLRALLNKLAPSDSLNSLAAQVAGHLLLEDEAPDQLARQLVERVQWEPLFAATYSRLCSVLVRVRSGFVFYKHLMARCRSSFSAGVRSLILEVEVDPTHQHPPLAIPIPSSSLSISPPSSSSGYPNHADLQRHRLKALVQFLCHLFLENLLAYEQLHQEYLQVLEGQLPDCVALECLCSALTVAGRSLEELRPQWVASLLHQMHDALQQLQEDRKLRMTFMVRDLLELHQRSWQPREPLFSPSAMDQAEP